MIRYRMRGEHDSFSYREGLMPPNAELSAAPLAGVEGEPGVGKRQPPAKGEAPPRRREGMWQATSWIGEAALAKLLLGDRALRVNRTQVRTAPAVSAAQRC